MAIAFPLPCHLRASDAMDERFRDSLVEATAAARRLAAALGAWPPICDDDLDTELECFAESDTVLES